MHHVFRSKCVTFSLKHRSVKLTSKVILFGIQRVVVGENTTFVGQQVFHQQDGARVTERIFRWRRLPSFSWSRDPQSRHGFSFSLLPLLTASNFKDSSECKELMTNFIKKSPHLWNEDIGEESCDLQSKL